MPQLDVHASAVAIREAGVLIRGPSGSGKSRLALALIAGARGAGAFSRLIGDDRIALEARHGRLIARGHPKIRGQIEQRGAGILRLPYIEAAVIRVVADLAPADEAARYPEPASEDAGARPLNCEDWDFRGLGSVNVGGLWLPSLVLPACVGASDLALVILQRFRFGCESGSRPRQGGGGTMMT
ncbi:HPr kinase [Methylocella tundrae]|uniref:HPr kinase n=1 Tax=Methylocella tundrae TaxID=227605 RepID=A0A8B6M4R7_METTU|nr:HPr kinase/phosphatase C-terminal domain-containing protein [Methylocella tundrae]VTZ49786.1 HPr kinase [Methylocella tundrae]